MSDERKPSGTWAPMPPPRNKAWEEAARDVDLSSAVPYRPQERYEVGQVIEHPKYGIGIVRGVKGNLAYVVFHDTIRKLAMGR
ncbi:MAG: hypothetical protein D6806_07295 [Deltaproteobacteria bacterium]|nr:MAG: hypothetical protein D6806_07295 [Deltaproteobacteria bacterium]